MPDGQYPVGNARWAIPGGQRPMGNTPGGQRLMGNARWATPDGQRRNQLEKK